MGYAIAKKEDYEAAEFLKQMAALRGEEDKEEAEQLPRVKINYDTESKVCTPGEWVVGQKKDKDGNIEEEGSKVAAFIALISRNAYSYYNQKDTKLNCNSLLFEDYGEAVTGSRLKNVCGKTCPMRHLSENGCKAQKVVFGVAVTTDGKFIDCVGYFSGIGFMPAADYIKSAKFLMTSDGKKHPTPICAHVASLSSTKEKNGSITYYIPVFTKAGILAVDDIEKLKAKCNDVKALIDNLNNAAAVKITEVKEPVSTTAKVDPDTIIVDAVVEEVAPASTMTNISEMFGSAPEAAKPSDIPPFTPSDDPDIANAIKAALGSMR